MHNLQLGPSVLSGTQWETQLGEERKTKHIDAVDDVSFLPNMSAMELIFLIARGNVRRKPQSMREIMSSLPESFPAQASNRYLEPESVLC